MGRRGVRASRGLAVAVVLALATPALSATLLDRLGDADRAVVVAAVTEAEALPDATDVLPDTLFAAARACEDALIDPARALRIYDRVLRIAPSSRIAVAARRRADDLRTRVGADGTHGREAAELGALMATADTLAPAEIDRRATALTAIAWPGAPDVALWHGDWLRRGGHLAEAAAQYATVVARWPDGPQARAARRGAAGVAIDAHDWDHAIALAEQLPVANDLDALERDDLVVVAQLGRRKDRVYVAAWVALAAAALFLIGSLVEASRRARRWPRVPMELAFLAPIAAVLVAISFTAHRSIAPAVTMISSGGVALAALSGATLDVLRASARPVRWRAVAHAAICVVAVAALVYIAMMRESLLDMLLETVRFGPEG